MWVWRRVELNQAETLRRAVLLEVEAAAQSYPIVFDFLPDLETFYRDWQGRPLPGGGAEGNKGIERQGVSV